MLTFRSSESYWINRYKKGGNSGSGSYGKFALFKADFINKFVETNKIRTIIEFGCGDGNQLTLAKYPSYTGFDISPDAIAQCKKMFEGDPSKKFYVLSEYKGQDADLTLSLDVIYHLIEDDVFKTYMQTLFSSSRQYVIVYSSNVDSHSLSSPHVKHRQFTYWVKTNLPEWELIRQVPNLQTDHPKPAVITKADFFVYQKNNGVSN